MKQEHIVLLLALATVANSGGVLYLLWRTAASPASPPMDRTGEIGKA